MELTNGVAKMQLFGSLGGYFITFGTSGGEIKKRLVVWGAFLYFSLSVITR
jgi:hypothetical protein